MTATSSSPNNSWAAARAAERRETRELEARLAREDADAALRRRLDIETARGEKARAERDAASRRRTARATARSATRARALTWINSHAVELLIYPIALLSFALAAPAMAAYGVQVYGPPGVLLAGITELGMWAFALAVVASRHQHPDRPVAGLQAGVVLFSLVAASMNLLHGLDHGLTTGVVMAVVSIAGGGAVSSAVARSAGERDGGDGGAGDVVPGGVGAAGAVACGAVVGAEEPGGDPVLASVTAPGTCNRCPWDPVFGAFGKPRRVAS